MKFTLFLLLILYSSLLLHAQEIEIDTVLIENTDWFKFYKNQNQNLAIKNFILTNYLSSFETIPGNIIPDYDPKFFTCNEKFIIESPDENKYIDLLSYSAVMDDKDSCKITGFEVDQEVDLVDRVNKTVKRIGFSGTSEMFEDAKWIDNEKFLIFGKGNYGINKPQLFIEFIDIKTNVRFILMEKNYYSYNKSYKAPYLE